MLIASRSRELNHNVIELGPMPLAVLSCTTSVKCVGLIETTLQNSGICELIVSSIPKKHWSDLWRLELETQDDIGMIQKILKILYDNEITVLFQESSIRTFDGANCMSFIFSGIGYKEDGKNKKDGNANTRSIDANCKLVFLESAIKLAILDQINFSESGNIRCKMNRIEVYRSLHNRCNIQDFIEIYPDLIISKDQNIRLPEVVKSHLDELFPDANLLYQCGTDTKNRLIRVLISSTSENLCFDIKFSIKFGATDDQLTVLTAIKRAGLSVIRHKIRVSDQFSTIQKLTNDGKMAEFCVSVVQNSNHDELNQGSCKQKIEVGLVDLKRRVGKKNNQDHIQII